MRVVSLLPAATEICAALGAFDHVVGVTHECDFPAEARTRRVVTASAIPAPAHAGVSPAGGIDDVAPADGPAPAEVDAAVRALSASGQPLFTLDEPGIAECAPDLLLTQALCDVCAVWEGDVRAVAERLGASSWRPPAVVTLGGTTLDGVCDDVQAVARALGREEAGAALVAALRARLLAVHAALRAARAPRPRVAVVEWTSPIFLAGHWGPEMVRRAGGVDVLGTAGAHSTTVTPEALAAAAPDVVLVAPCGYDLPRAAAEARALLDDPAWAWLAGRAVWALDANALLSRPGPRLVDGVEVLARLLHPALFGGPAPQHARPIA